MESIDQDYFNSLADWAESDTPVLSDAGPMYGPDDRTLTHDLLRRASSHPIGE